VAGIALLMLLLLAVVVPSFVVSLALWVVGLVRPPRSADVAARSARRHARVVWLASASAGTLTAAALLWLPSATWHGVEGWVWSVAPFVAVAVLAVVHALGELTWPRPRGAVRSAPLARRTVRAVGGGRLALLVATATGTTLAIVVFGLTATPDGRFVRAHVTTGAGYASGPYPGWVYGLPMLVALALALAATAAALRLITRRRPLSGLEVADDEELRRASVVRLLSGAQLGIGGAAALLLLFTSDALAQAGWSVWSVVCVGLGLGAGAVTCVAVASGVFPWLVEPLVPRRIRHLVDGAGRPTAAG
jgi:hypothetical protein